MASPPNPFPSFDQLPLREGDPPNSAWGLWGRGPESALGSLNYLTNELVLKAINEEVKTGERVGLNLPLDLFNPPLLGRAGFEQKVIDKNPLVVNDDVLQHPRELAMGQLAAFCVSAGQEVLKRVRIIVVNDRLGLIFSSTTQADIHATASSVNSLQSWCARGLAGRGVLIDYASYALRQGIDVDHFAQHTISLKDVVAIAQDQGVEFHRGDVLFLRTGYVAAYKKLDAAGRERVAGIREWCGLAQSRETAEWLWQRQFAAVASDSPGFEVRPPTEKEWHLHPILLAGWGTPIGELFDLDMLAEQCVKNKRWSFFYTSAPLNYSGAVASPPNATAIL